MLLTKTVVVTGLVIAALGGSTGTFQIKESVTLVAPLVPTASTALVPACNINGHVNMQLVLVVDPWDTPLRKSSTESQLA